MPAQLRAYAAAVTFVELRPTAVAAGGESVARDASGRVVFVRGTLPGERVRAVLTEEKRSFARADTIEVLEPSADRREPPCPHVAEGCGGCDWQHVAHDAQRRQRRDVVVDALTRIGHLSAPVVELGPDLPSERYRTTVRCTVVDGHAGYRRRRSHDGIAVDSCLVAHPLVEELVRDGRFGDAREVTLRAGARTGERLLVAHPSADDVDVPADVLVVGADELRAGRRAWFHEEVAGRTWRVSATSFFQDRPDGAEALVDRARLLVERHAPDADTVVDLCAGVGLFAGTLADGRRVMAVERHRAAVADARTNLAGVDATVVRASFEGWRPSPADVVVADPARTGLGRVGVDVVAAAEPDLVVLISCDPAALGRDAGLLVAKGFQPTETVVVDLFPHTSHVETVTGFTR